MRIAIVNHAPALVDPDELAYIAQAVQSQVRQHFVPAWGIAPVIVRAAASGQVASDEYLVGIFTDADQPGALGYHDDSLAGKVFAGTVIDQGGGTVLGAGQPDDVSVSSVVSHEVLELIADLYCNSWWDTGQGFEVAGEVCDPVESDSYHFEFAGGRVSVAVSNFVFPAWGFAGAPAGARFDQLSKLTAPFSMDAGGYVVYRSVGADLQKMAEHAALSGALVPKVTTAARLPKGATMDARTLIAWGPGLAEWRKVMKGDTSLSRTARRVRLTTA